jgi:hypothetical protein
MANLAGALQDLRKERDRAAHRVERLDEAIAVLTGLAGRNHPGGVRTRRTGRRMSASARRRIAAAQRARWAKWKLQHRKKAA